MDKLFNILLVLHIIGGSIGLLIGTGVLFLKKGNRRHKSLGKVFAYSLLSSALAGLFMSLMHKNYFLLIIAVFTLYLIGTGLRYLRLRQLHKTQKPKSIDWILLLMMSIFSLAFFIYGLLLLLSQKAFGIVLISFGSISALMAIADLKTFKGRHIRYKNYWMLLHLQRMTAAYIASLTAFLVVNNNFFPALLAWLLPTLLLTPLIFVWSRKYAKAIGEDKEL